MAASVARPVADALVAACETGDVELLRRFCAASPGLLATTKVDAEGYTCAHVAAFYQQRPVLELCRELCPTLLSTAAADGRVPGHEAASAGSAATIELLGRLGSPLCVPGIARTAAAGGHAAVLRALVAATQGRADVIDPTDAWFTSAHAAACCGHADVIRVLHELAPQSLSAATELGWTVAHAAASTGNTNCLALLGRLGVALDRPSALNGVRPWQLACLSSLGCTMELAVLGVDTSRTESEQPPHISQDVAEFLDILRGPALLLAAQKRLAFCYAANKARCKVWLCDDLVEQIGQLVSAARVARAVWTARELQRCSACFTTTLAQCPEEDTYRGKPKRQRT